MPDWLQDKAGLLRWPGRASFTISIWAGGSTADPRPRKVQKKRSGLFSTAKALAASAGDEWQSIIDQTNPHVKAFIGSPTSTSRRGQEEEQVEDEEEEDAGLKGGRRLRSSPAQKSPSRKSPARGDR